MGTRRFVVRAILVVGCVATASLSVHAQALCFSPAVNYPTGIHPGGVAAADLDGDGDVDLVVADGGALRILVLKNDGQGTFDTVKYEIGFASWSPCAADLDGDGDVDLVVACSPYGPLWGDVAVLRNNGDGSFAAPVQYGELRYATAVFAADLDGDGDLDLAVAVGGGPYNYVSILKNNGDGTFGMAVNYPAGLDPMSVFAADLDGDGDLDLAVANYGGDSASVLVSVLMNNGDGTFSAATNYTTEYAPSSVIAADLDGDGDFDLAVSNWYSASVSILTNKGDGTFSDAINYRVGDTPSKVIATDVDGDGDLDLVTANLGSRDVSVLRNHGDGVFAAATYYSVGANPNDLAAADLDGDGDPDLAVNNNGGSNVSILMNCTVPCRCPHQGDVDGSGFVDVTDILSVIGIAFVNGADPQDPICPRTRGDVNNSGVVDVNDVLYIIKTAFLNGPDPVNPCGP